MFLSFYLITNEQVFLIVQVVNIIRFNELC